ncbi:hypothetical protein MPSEU_000622000 [Mayamaea pseudoterrestris]|nr:hypothetical protein MPSEU_000622000 [Mayamaea pseudoterrestris]
MAKSKAVPASATSRRSTFRPSRSKTTSSSSSPYHQAANLLNELLFNDTARSRRSSFKSLVYDADGKMKCSKSAYAQVANILKCQSQLEEMMQVTGLLNNNDAAAAAAAAGSSKKASVSNQGLACVLVYELILGPNKRIMGGGALKRLIVSHQEDLQRAADAWAERHPTIEANADSSNNMVQHARYLRVNTLATTTEQVVKRIQNILLEEEAAAGDSNPVVYLDPHVPDLLVVSPHASSKLLADTMLSATKNAVVWQDKSSCFSALCLAKGWSDTGSTGDYLDACAAPGNKTLHLASLLNAKLEQPQGVQSTNGKNTKTSKKATKESATPSTTIYALDRSGDRHAVLEQRIQQYCSKNDTSDHQFVKVVPQHLDCLTIQPDDYSNVHAILLDPTCSGSGVVTDSHQHAASETDTDAASQRLESLSNFQVTCLKHFMSFPQVNRIVYSTCSVHVQENEDVIAQVLAAANDEWVVHAPVCLEHWLRRGQVTSGLSQEQANAMIRVDPYKDGTNGFFVCCLERKKSVAEVDVVGESTSAKNVTKDSIQRQQKVLGIPLYNEEFAKLGPVASSTRAVRKDQNDSNEVLSTSHANKSQKVSATASPAAAKRIASSKPPPNKKVAKKYDWKRQQREAKLLRVGQGKKTKGTVP